MTNTHVCRPPQVSALVDLLDRMMALEPEKRIDPDAAMRHPFLRPHLPKKHEHDKGGKQAAGTGQREGSVPA